jgi:hypothetical protein
MNQFFSHFAHEFNFNIKSTFEMSSEIFISNKKTLFCLLNNVLFAINDYH